MKPVEEIKIEKLEYTATEIPKKIDVHLQFGHFFNSYAKAINKRYNRTGSLFEKNFERKEVSTIAYFKKLIHYIHFNPVKHGFQNIFGIILGVLIKVLFLISQPSSTENL